MADQKRAINEQDPRVQAALREYMELQDQGRAFDQGQFLADHADIADELRSFISGDEQLAALQRAAQRDVSTQSVAERGMETIIPQRVQAAERQSNKSALPPEFGRYRIEKPLGSGAMGTVYLAEDSQLHRKVALKTPSFDEDETGELLERFYREARSAATLRHSNICPVYDVGEISGRHYISMAYIKGRPLSAYIQPGKPQSERNILVIVRKIALALQEAHDHGIIHRDLKPGNIMVDEKGEPIIMDFGLARKVQKDGESRLTQSGMIVGSPAYMSPEQVEADSDKLTAAADQYSLGVILYELLTGRLPFRGGVTAVIGAILTKDPPPIADARSDVSPRIAALCARMMHKRAAERFPSCKAAADEMAAILRDAPAAEPRAAASATPESQPAAPPPGHRRSATPPPSRPTAPAAAAAAGAAASVTQSNVTSLYEAAQKCMRKHDYEQVVQMLDTIPSEKRTAEVNALLTKARGLADEVAFLLAEIDEATRLNDNESLARKADELLKLKPRHHKALQLKEEFRRYGNGRMWKPGGYTPDGRRIGEGSWIPWIGIAVGVVAFGLALWAVTIYLKSGDAVVRIQINDPDVEVSFQGRTLNIQSAGQDLKVDPGEDTLVIRYGDAVFETGKFSLNKGDNPAVVIDLLDDTLAAKFGDLEIGQWPIEPRVAGTTPDVIDPENLTYAALQGGAWEPVLTQPDDFGRLRRDSFQNGEFHLSGVSAPVYVRSHRARNMAFRARVRRVGGGALHFRLRSQPVDGQPAGYSFWIWGGEKRPVGIAKHTLAGEWQDIVVGTKSVSEADEHEMLVAAVEDKLQLYVDGELVVEARDAEITGEGLASFNAVAGGGDYYLRDFAIRALDESSAEGWTDLLAQVVPNEENSHGNWTRDGQGRLHGTPDQGRYCNLGFADQPTGSYELEFGVLFHSAETFALVHMPAGVGRASVVLYRRGENHYAGWETSGTFGSSRDEPGQRVALELASEIEHVVRVQVQVDGNNVRLTGTVNGVSLPPLSVDARQINASGPPPGFPRVAEEPLGLRDRMAIRLGGDGGSVMLSRFRYQPLEGSSAPAANGWTDLFNGRDLTGWNQVGDGGWTVQNGILTSKPGEGWIATAAEFANFELQLEFKLTAQANSGVFLRIPDEGALSGADFMEVQLIDDAIQPNVESWQRTGAIYAVKGPISPANPVVGQWHKLSVLADGPEITVSIDGAEVNRVNVETAPVLGSPKRDLKRSSGHIGFQHRRQPVEFRNIRIRELDPAAASAASETADWQDLFNGRDLTGWQGDSRRWEIRNEVLAATTASGPVEYLMTDEEYADFELRLEFRLLNQGNSGVQFRSTRSADGKAVGHQAEIGYSQSSGAVGASITGDIYGQGMNKNVSRAEGSQRAAIDRALRSNDWNEMVIRCNGPHEVIEVNGIVAADVTDDAAPRSGRIGLQLFNRPEIEFRSIRVRELDPPADVNAADWTDLFNGRNLAGWQVKGPQSGWTVQDGALTATDGSLGNTWIETDTEYSDFELQLECKLVSGGDTGVFLRIPDVERPHGGDFLEIQLADAAAAAGLEHWQLNGSVYSLQGPNPPAPLEIGQWQLITIRAVGPEITVSINGREVNRVNIDTAAILGPVKRDLHSSRGRIGLQRHGPPVQFRNIRVRELAAAAASAVPVAVGWTDLFNGQDLTGWQPMETIGSGESEAHRASSGGWRVANGELLCATNKAGWLKSASQYTDFELELEFKLAEGDNSDLLIRCPATGHLSKTGMAIQIIDEHSGKFEMRPDNRPGAIWGAVGHDILPSTGPLGTWNRLRVRCEGARVQVSLNDQATVDADLDAVETLRDRPRGGFIGLSNWAGEANGMSFRNIRIRDLSAAR